jgi:aryl-alcohol dehydrogenase-like predicted oxidoreductase
VAEEIITTAYDNGINHFDISDPYQVLFLSVLYGFS